MNKKIINFIVVSIISFSSSFVYWYHSNQVGEYLSLSLYRPTVYRQLTPMLARSLTWFGVPENWSVVIVMTAAGICFYYTLRALVYCFYGEKE